MRGIKQIRGIIPEVSVLNIRENQEEKEYRNLSPYASHSRDSSARDRGQQ